MLTSTLGDHDAFHSSTLGTQGFEHRQNAVNHAGPVLRFERAGRPFEFITFERFARRMPVAVITRMLTFHSRCHCRREYLLNCTRLLTDAMLPNSRRPKPDRIKPLESLRDSRGQTSSSKCRAVL